ncbi:hypothetical protein OAS25_04245 [Alphaproteobacteria bacterium]|nr:hypothetical protein [Alphaproteobacteria bacterium]
MKKFLIFPLIILSFGCQKEKMNEVGVGYNKTLIIPPSNDLPTPGTNDFTQSNQTGESDNPLVNSILEQTEANSVNNAIIDKIDEDSGYKSDEGFFRWLIKGKSER